MPYYMSGLLKYASSLLKLNQYEMVDLAFPVDDYTFATKASHLATVFKLKGIGLQPGSTEFLTITNKLNELMKPMLAKAGHHTISIVFNKDNELTRRNLENMTRASIQTVKNLGLAVEDIIQETVDVMTQETTFEEAYIVIWTHLKSVDQDDVKQKATKLREAMAKLPFSISDCANPYTYIDEAYDKHCSQVSAFNNELPKTGLLIERMKVHDAARAIKLQLEKDVTSFDFRPTLFGDKLITRSQINQSPKERASDIMWPRLDFQLARAPHEGVEGHDDTIKIGSTYYTPIYVEMCPKDVVRFNKLFNAIDQDINYRINFNLSQRRPFGQTFRSTVNSFIKWMHPDNKLLEKGLNSVNEENVALQIVMVISNRDLKVLERHKEISIRALQSWGADPVFDVEDPSQMITTTSLAANHKNPATMSLPKLLDAILMLPIMRPSSHWETGTIINKSLDGKVMPYIPGSNQQESMCDLMVAKPRQGKSVLSQAINFGLCIKPGIKALPFIGVIDIGASSKGFIELLRDSLAEDKKHLAIYYKLQMKKEDAINFFDIQLGLNTPLPTERSVIINTLCLMATPDGDKVPPKDISQLISAVVDEAYRLKSNKLTANKFSDSIGTEPVIEAFLERKKFTVSSFTTWYQVRDFLFDQEEIELAQRAQRYAVPTMGDINVVASSTESIQRLYATQSGENSLLPGENSLLQTFKRTLSAIQRDYPIFNGVTQLDFSDARIIAIDLQDVTPKSSAPAIKQTSIMCMMARYLVSKNFYLAEEHIDYFDNRYRQYQTARIKDIQSSDKRIVIDEFHRYNEIDAVPSQMETDQKEGGKWGVQTCAISQEITDFSKGMIKNATNTYIMGGSKSIEIDEICSSVGLTKTEESILRNGILHGPKKGGACYLHKFDTRDGSFSHIMRNPKGPIELWSYSTTRKDMTLREYVKDKLGAVNMRKALALSFPSGSAAQEIELRMGEFLETDDDLIDLSDDVADVIQQLSQEVAQRYRDKQAA